MSDLVEWLRACIAEDETASVHEEACGWNLVEYDDDSDVGDANGGCVCGIGARWDAVCKAHRDLLDLHDVAHHCADGTLQSPFDVPLFAGIDSRFPVCATIKLLATAYADRPGYRQEWLT